MITYRDVLMDHDRDSLYIRAKQVLYMCDTNHIFSMCIQVHAKHDDFYPHHPRRSQEMRNDTPLHQVIG